MLCDSGLVFGPPIGGELGGGKVAVRSAGSVHVAVDAVVLDDHSGFEERFEVQQIEQLVAEPAVERLNPCVLPG